MDDRQRAELDAVLYGRGYLYQGKALDPSGIEVVDGATLAQRYQLRPTDVERRVERRWEGLAPSPKAHKVTLTHRPTGLRVHVFRDEHAPTQLAMLDKAMARLVEAVVRRAHETEHAASA